MTAGRVEAIFLAQPAKGERVQVERATAVAGEGLEGDAFNTHSESRQPKNRVGRDLTLIEAEAIEGLARDSGIELEPFEPRRNVVTRGIALNDLVGKRFVVGEVVCYGDRLCDPCQHLEGLTQPGVLKGLVSRGGLRADILDGGELHVGDEVRPIPG